MSRVALIGANSVEFVNLLIDIWNNGDCAVLIDYQIPVQTAIQMMIEAQVVKCYVERKYYKNIKEYLDQCIELIQFDNETILAQLLPSTVYDKFHENYSFNEAIVIYSSGTTGDSKGIILSHFAINTNADAIIDYMTPTKEDCLYIVRNLTHSSTIIGELLVSLKTRSFLLLAPVIVPPRYVINNIEKYKVTILGLNPLLLSMYSDEIQKKKYDISSLKRIYVSGSILDDKTYRVAHDLFIKQEIYNVYGLSEAGPRVTAQRYGCCKENSVGKPVKGVEIAIVDEQGHVVQNGEKGIIHVNTPSSFNGYIQGKIKNKSLYRDWLNTGDIGYIDEFKEVHIVGRVDDMIIINAHKIYPSEIEHQIKSYSDIRECVVTSITFSNIDYLCCLYVSDGLIRDDIKRSLSLVLMKYEIPEFFVKSDKLPRTQNGKISLPDVKKIALMECEKIKKK